METAKFQRQWSTEFKFPFPFIFNYPGHSKDPYSNIKISLLWPNSETQVEQHSEFINIRKNKNEIRKPHQPRNRSSFKMMPVAVFYQMEITK